MKPWILVTFPLMLMLPCFWALADSDHVEARRLVESGSILPLEQVLKAVVKDRPGRILEVEMENDDGRHIYDIELLDARGRVWEYKIDAHSGQLLNTERED